MSQKLEILLTLEEVEEITSRNTRSGQNGIKIARGVICGDEFKVCLYYTNNENNPSSAFAVGKSFYFSLHCEKVRDYIIGGKDMDYTLDEAYSKALFYAKEILSGISI